MNSVTDEMKEYKVNETRYLLSGKNKAILLKSVKDVKENKALIQKELFPED